MKNIIFLIVCISFISGDILSYSIQRTAENRLYKTITKINTIQYYINKYIMTVGKIPQNSTTLASSTNGKITIGTYGNWPRSIDTLGNPITFSIVYNNTAVKYMDIFEFKPSIEAFHLAQQNVALNSDAYFKLNDGGTNYDLIIPLNIQTIIFLQKAIPLKKFFDTSPGCHPFLPSCKYVYSSNNEICDTNNNQGRTWFKPDGIGGFLIQFCYTGASANKWVPTMDSSIKNFIDKGSYISPFNNSKVYYTNGVTGSKAIYTDSTTILDIN